jgi:muconate cycloisomerase
MKIVQIETYCPTLPFRFAFEHSLAARKESTNLIVKVRLENGVCGYGESIPRSYVTGEDIDGAQLAVMSNYAPEFVGLDLADSRFVIDTLSDLFLDYRLDRVRQGSSWCALELAVLDACGKLNQKSVYDLLAHNQKLHGKATASEPNAPQTNGRAPSAIRYGAVVPFCKERALTALLWFYKVWGFQTVKIKVGKNLDEDLRRMAIARKILGPNVTLRVDANAAWDVEETLKSVKPLKKLNVVSIEQPVSASDLDGLAKISRETDMEIVVDESLCTIDDALRLIAAKACRGFNIRISKVGGIFAARTIAKLARDAGLACHLGAQVGECGILSAAGRTYACLEPAMSNYEGSDNLFLLKQDITKENLTVGLGGKGNLLTGSGLGVTVLEDRLQKFCQQN